MNRDFYKILGVAHSATQHEIKKAYRQLVKKFHPDKNNGNPAASTAFFEIQEAYEVLSSPNTRSVYNQQHWYSDNSRKRQPVPMATPSDILNQCKTLNQYLATLDGNHINRLALDNYLRHLLSGSNLHVLKIADDTPANRLITEEVLKALRHLPYSSILKVCENLLTIVNGDTQAKATINGYLQHKRNADYWDKYLPVLVLVVAVFLCVLIFFTSRQ